MQTSTKTCKNMQKKSKTISRICVLHVNPADARSAAALLKAALRYRMA